MRYKSIYAACGITGDPSPSEADLRLTRRILEASRILQINLLDHVIIGSPAAGRSSYFSFKESGVIS
jgi:DNA repair protein RadC